MNHSPAKVLGEYLKAQSIATAFGSGSDWACFISHYPDGTDYDNVIVLFDTPGVRQGRLMNGTEIIRPGVQVMVRAQDYETGYQKMEAIKTCLAAVSSTSQAVSGSTYTIQNASLQSNTGALTEEESSRRRQIFTANYLLTISEV